MSNSNDNYFTTPIALFKNTGVLNLYMFITNKGEHD